MKNMETITTFSSETNRIWTELIDNEEVDPHSPKRRRINDLDNELELKEDIEDKLNEKDNEEVDIHSSKPCVYCGWVSKSRSRSNYLNFKRHIKVKQQNKK